MILVKGLKCPKCGKKTLSNPQHSLWCIWKNYSKAYCRSCGSKFKEVVKVVDDAKEGDSND